MTESTASDAVQRFCDALAKLNVGDRARLRRAGGRPLGEVSDALPVFYRVLPPMVSELQEETYFLLATLYPRGSSGGSGDLGLALRRAAIQARQDGQDKGIDSRMRYLLDADETQLGFRLRQAVHLITSRGVSIDWPQLLRDLLYWDHPDRFVQKRWARSYYGESRPEGEEK